MPKRQADDGGAKSKKAKKIPDKEASQTILKYMREQNRPFNAIMLFQNLHGAVGKTQAVKLLESLASDGLLVEKHYGKQKIYWVTQEGLEVVDNEQLLEMNAHIKRLKAEVADEASRHLGLKSDIRSLQSARTNDEVERDVASLETENETLREKIAAISSSVSLVSSADREKLEKDYDLWKRNWLKRKRMCKNMLDQMLEQCPVKPKKVYEDAGLEFDEEYNVNPTNDRTSKRRAMLTK